MMILSDAEKIALEVVNKLTPYCEKIVVAGSIRRKKKFVNDIDIVLVPKDLWGLTYAISSLGPVKMSGMRIQRVTYKNTQIDLYFATPDTWGTLLLIRTGSTENNIRLCTIAKKKGWHLHASGEGLFGEGGQHLAGESEESIFEALGVPYQKPEERG